MTHKDNLPGLELPEPYSVKAYALAALPGDDVLKGPDPTIHFINSIKELGVITPITLMIGDKEDDVRVMAGRRRIKAARRAGLTHIPALIYHVGTINAQLVTLVENTQRHRNLVAEYDAAVALLEQGMSPDQIASSIHQPVPSIHKLLALKALSPTLEQAWRNGDMAPTTAEAAAKLTTEQQERLEALYEENGRVRGKDVKAAKTARTRAAAEALPEALFETAGVSDNPLSRYDTDALIAELERRGVSID